METEFVIKAGEFEGPLELLLELIERRKLHINDLSLSQVAADFIEHTKSYGNFPLSDSADFILIASTLLLIKSKSLLPNLELTEEERGNIEDLEARLALYKKFRSLASHIKEFYGRAPLYFADENREMVKVFAPTGELTITNLLQMAKATLLRIPKVEKLSQVMIERVVSLEEMIEGLHERIRKNLKTSFRDFADFTKGEKIKIIVGFLAMLELVKRGVVRVRQEAHFSDIEIEGENVNTPTYV